MTTLARRTQSKSKQTKEKVGVEARQWRFWLVIVVIIAVFMSLVARAAFIQVISPDDLIKQGDNRTIRVRDKLACSAIFNTLHTVFSESPVCSRHKIFLNCFMTSLTCF